ncbi:MAG TPA: hypothetical protein VIJ62_00630, partial [Rhizomicrobium sp.]
CSFELTRPALANQRGFCVLAHSSFAIPENIFSLAAKRAEAARYDLFNLSLPVFQRVMPVHS